MRKTVLMLTALVTLAACGETPFERGVTGAAAGAGTAMVVDGNVATGALLGAGAGVASGMID
jgi:osmotically inducible lipoprotein OsmB